MPNVNNLFKRNPAASPPIAVQNPQANPVVNPNAPVLIESKQQPGNLVLPNLPGWLQQTVLPETMAPEYGTLVGFGSVDSKSWVEQQQAGVAEGQPYLKSGANFIPLPRLEFYVLRAESYQSMMYGSEGKFLFATKDLATPIPDRIHGNQVVKAEPHYVVSMVAVVNGNHHPCRADFRGTKGGAAEGPITAVKAAQAPDWGRQGDAFRVACSFPEPFGRVYHIITTRRDISKTSGNPYYRCLASSTPSTVSQMQALVNAFLDKSFDAEMETSNKWYEERVKMMDNLCKNGPQVVV